jgi:hypothetical protein
MAHDHDKKHGHGHAHAHQGDDHHGHERRHDHHDHGAKQSFSTHGDIPAVGGGDSAGGASASELAFGGHVAAEPETEQAGSHYHEAHEPEKGEAAMVIADCTVKFDNGKKHELCAGSYVEVFSTGTEYAHVRVYSGHKGHRALVKLDNLHQQPAVTETDGKNDPISGYMQYRGPLWNGHPKAKDVDQGAISDCYIMSPAAALAAKDPEAIMRLFGDHEPNQSHYKVTLYRGKHHKPVTVTVDCAFPSKGNLEEGKGRPVYAGKKGDNSDVSTENEKAPLWPLLLEKAFAMVMGGGKDDEGYESLDGGGRADKGGFEMLTGKKSHLSTFEDAGDAMHKLKSMMKNGREVCCNTKDPETQEGAGEELKKAGLAPWHFYWLHHIDGDKLHFRNPWGHDHPKPMTAETFVKCFNTMQSVTVPTMAHGNEGPGLMGGGAELAGGQLDMPQHKQEEATT